MKRIPILAAQQIADAYDYDQVVIIARRVGEQGGEQVTTYGRNQVNSDVAAHIGRFLTEQVMKWEED